MRKPVLLDASVLKTELSKLPTLTASSTTNLDPVHTALARAIASGQDAAHLTQDLSMPAGWSGVDLTQPPANLVPSAKIVSEKKTAPIKAIATEPEWIAKITPAALSQTTTTRVVVLDREPTALGGLEVPAWARALKPSAVYGPVKASSGGAQLQTEKWIIVYTILETVELVRGGVVLCVVPVSIFHFGSSESSSIVAGSAWLAVQPFVSSAPADSFAGIAIQSGTITSTAPLSYSGTTVTIPTTATLNITLVPSVSSPGPAGFPASITAPTQITIAFPPTGNATIAFNQCSGSLYGEAISASPTSQPAAYNAQLKLLYLPGQSSQPNFTPESVTGKLLTLSGSAPILSAGWALSVNESTTPQTLGTAASSGDFAIAFGAGLSCQWTGCNRPELSAGGALIAQNNALLLGALSGVAPGVLIEQRFQLWDDQNSNSGNHCQLIAARETLQPLLYALVNSNETLELGAILEAWVDRPVLATGARVPAIFLEGLVVLIHNGAHNTLLVYSATPLPQLNANNQPKVYPMALDNAMLDVSQPLAIAIYARTDANFNSTEGLVLLLFGFLLVELYLPDPYAGAIAPNLPPRDIARNPTFADTANQSDSSKGSSLPATYGYLAAEVGFLSASQVALRLWDTAHSHPVTPPTLEASSSAVSPFFWTLPAAPVVDLLESKTLAKPEVVTADSFRQPTSTPFPRGLAGTMLLDVSTRASQLGVEVATNERYVEQYTIDGLSVRGPANLLPLATLPPIAWEPMYNKATGTSNNGVSNSELLHPPNDGPIAQVRSTSATLIPISPLQSLRAVLAAGVGNFEANFTLPFGMVAAVDTNNINGTVLPSVSLVRPVFPETSTPTGSIYTGAWQLSFAAPDPTVADPVLAGRTYLRTETDNPTSGYSYGEQVLSPDVADIFSSRFNPSDPTLPRSTGVPLRRYDLTGGYGATTFSEWTNTEPLTTDVLKAHFHVLIGRTSHEVIQVQSLIYPWAIKVVRTITIERQGSGVVQRYDSGWIAASDGMFAYPNGTGITRDQIHSGLIDGVINVKNIQELGLPVKTNGTQDFTGYTGVAVGKDPKPAKSPTIQSINVQPVTFDADVIIQPNHTVLQGGVKLTDLVGAEHTCVKSTSITGWIGLQFEFHLSLANMAAFPAMASGAGGPISATLNVGKANSLLRATEFDATPVHDTATSNIGIACSVRGLPKLSSDGHWSVATIKPKLQAAPTSLGANVAAPLVQPNKSGTSAPGTDIHFADPADIFRLAAGSATPPTTFYGFLQATGTQSNFLSRPILSVGSDKLTLGDALNVAHAGALLGAVSNFPGLSSCLQFLGTELDSITNQLQAPSLATSQNKQFTQAIRNTPVKLIDVSIAQVDLCFRWLGDDVTQDVNPANVIVSLGQPTDPSWSLSVNRIAVTLTIPALSSKPVMWLQGGFHADADTTPAFPDLKCVFDGPLNPITQFMTVLQDITSVIDPGSGGQANPPDAKPGLNVSFSDGTLTVTDNFTLPDIPLGPGTISDVSLDIGATLDILALTVGFMVSIGTMDAPCHWIVDPLSGTIAVGAGVKNNEIDIFIEAGIGVGLAIDLGIASGSASIVLAFSLEINGDTITIMILLTGQAQVDVLGGLASASISITCGLGLSFPLQVPPSSVTMIGTASVGIHISICWIINIDFSGSWTFQKSVPLHQLT